MTKPPSQSPASVELAKRNASVGLAHSPARIGLALLFTTVGGCTFGLATGGTRAETGECPADETCSDATPYGVLIYVLSTGGWPNGDLPTLAAGGTAHIAFDATDLPPHYVMSTQTDVLSLARDRDLFEEPIEAYELHARAPGGAWIRIVDAYDQTLFDRARFEVRSVATIDVRSPSTWCDGRAPAGSRMTFSFDLLDADGDELLDESRVITVEGGVARETTDPLGFDWDSFEVDVDADATELIITVRSGGVSGELRLDVVDPTRC